MSSEAPLEVRVHRSLADIGPSAWDAIAGDDDPFVEHAFLFALEESGSVGRGTGWEPRHLTLWRQGALVAALPCYLKSHSYGEYIFDFAWASAAQRARLRYYPKMVAMVPMTPATGTRLLVHPAEPYGPAVARLLDALVELVIAERASGAHLNFLSERERDAVAADPRFLPRISHQYHFHNAPYASFDALLEAFRSPARKQVRKERRVVAESGLRVVTKTGPELDARDWSALRAFYFDTCARKGSTPYLDARFFDLLRERVAHRVVAVLAYEGDEPVAGTLSFEKGKRIYGRYWGANEAYDRLHFELCYYRLIDRAIERGCDRFEAGAQGEHKIKRGLLPVEIHSSHYLHDPWLRQGIAEFLPRETAHVRALIAELSEESPFRRGELGGGSEPG